MTEAEWEKADDPGPMLDHLGKRVTPRKRRLFAVACCRRMQFVADEAAVGDRGADYRRAVDTSERYADRLATRYELRKALEGADDSAFSNASAAGLRDENGCCVDPFQFVAAAKVGDIWRDLLLVARFYGTDRSPAAARRRYDRRIKKMRPDDERAEREAQAGLLRCLFPYRPATLAKSHRAAVAGYAERLYEERWFDHMPDLADELKRAGCKDKAILAHCRKPGEHARGCWVLDLCLRKG